MKRVALVLAAITVAVVGAGTQSEKIDYQALGKIRDEGLNRSQVMDHISWLSDVYGPRLTGSPAMQQASEWVMKRFGDWGLANIHQERWKLGKGWALVRLSANMVEPQTQPLIAYPREWSAGTHGPVTAEVVRTQITSESDFEKYRGKLAGKIVLTQPARRVRMYEGPNILRMNDKWTAEAEETLVPGPAAAGGLNRAAQEFRKKLDEFYRAEGVVATFDRGSDSDMSDAGSTLSWQQQRPDGGTVFPGASFARDETAGTAVPGLTLAVEHYNRMVRVLDKGVPVKVALDIEVKFYDETGMNGFNTIAELPGTDLGSEIVLLGAHLDSHPYATGATDNATGSAAMIEAVRIIKAAGLKPRRTIRVALWGGEEQGLLGSRAYVADHIADVATMALKPEHAKVTAYFNSDNGSGKVRGIWMQSNLAVKPIFEQWFEPLRDLGVSILSPRSVTQTDHVSFDDAGIPAFQLLVDRLEYNSRTHHSNMDTFDRVQRDDMIQQATVMAVIAYEAAMRDEKLPRKALPPPQRRSSPSESGSAQP
ncbi:MAG TPA: M20/M25/M40 family metallo-hydrolase [Vicinamibacterales bacterium]|jgi:carboxypeptidase Q|nr:M20/M25/M40 family metallo-hydrolase [Vicinamibacterales bacterium]